jgi:putative membrane protein
MLLVLGMYEITLNAINTLNIPFLIPLGIGLALGTFGTAKIIERFLQKHPRKTYMLIIGFVVGSLAEVFPGIPTGWQLPVSVVLFLAGFALMFMLGKKGLAD